MVKDGYADEAEGGRTNADFNIGGADFYKGVKVDTSLVMIFFS